MKFARNKLTRTAAVAMTLLAMNAHDAWSALSTKVETLAAIAGTGNQTINTTGFQPKAVLFWITDRTSAGNSPDARFGRGWTDGTNQAAAATAWDDGTDVGAGVLVTDKTITLINEAGTVLADASIVTLNSDGFTINWATAGGSRLVTYLAFGGSDLVWEMPSSPVRRVMPIPAPCPSF